jgi:eukaryotic-like serine/threonine-protein kinase
MKTALDRIGRYRVDGLLGSGAMGEVYRAYDPIIDRPVAIKLVRPELSAGSDAEQWMQRFRREARAAGRRFHPNIVAILDFGDDNGVPFLAMEYVEGRSLDAVIKTSSPIESGRSVTVISQVLSALGFAHQNGIIHRDVKPSNILILENDDVKVADFGIARIDTSEFTIVGDLLGTPAYMAPEQFSGTPVDERTDLFAVGVILFEMLTGVKPFRGRSVTEIMSLMETRGPEDIGTLNPAVPGPLRQVITKALAFDPSRRYPNARTLAAAMAEAFPDATVPRLPQLAQPSSEPSSAAPPPAPPRTERSSGSAPLDPELLSDIERDLASFIGPVASIAIKRALRQSSDIAVLYDLLSMYIDNQHDRAAFLRLGRHRGHARQGQTASSSRPLEAGSATGQNHGQGRAFPSPTAISVIEASLTQYIGPIAKVLVKREIGRFDTLESLCLVLAMHIPTEREREAFLRGMRENPRARGASNAGR